MNWIAIAGINLSVAVALGAFGAHGLKSIVSSEQLAWWHTGTLYLFFHALGLLMMGILIKGWHYPQGMAWTMQLGMLIKGWHYPQGMAWTMQLGMLIFAGSLFAMTLGLPRWLGAITPIGGVLMMGAWLWLAWAAIQNG